MTDDNLLATLLSIASSARPTLNPECLFATFPRNRLFLDPARCECCQDATVEKGELCEECKVGQS